jgi:acetone carboxylase gamma subunit
MSVTYVDFVEKRILRTECNKKNKDLEELTERITQNTQKLKDYAEKLNKVYPKTPIIDK